ncbi:MAG TPA: gluconate 2-dehydrogenase subunit 3 family protein [Opitutaceae bacterium]|nr:gluconate 2-dehydrogenase subunit 3 family protein [Opitutaceae bacterium]
MNRREALILMAGGFGGAIFGARRMLAGVANAAEARAKVDFSGPDMALLNEVGETILPATAGSGGAKAANTAGFMRDMVRDFYDEDEQATFIAGLGLLQAASRGRFVGRGYLELTPTEQHDLLLGLDRAKPQPEYYRMIRQLTILGFFTSEVGATQAMNHVAVPGRFDGMVTIAPGTKAWSE